MKQFAKARLPFVTCFIMDKNAAEFEPALMITDGEILARKWVNKKGLNGLVRYENIVDFLYILWYDEITGLINRGF